MQLTKCDGQAWLALTNLVCDPKCRARYRYDDARKRSMERLKRHFNDVLFDQLPVLQDLQRAVDEVLLMVTPSAHEIAAGRLILEQVPRTRDALLARSDDAWRDVAAAQLATHFADSRENREAARRRAEDMSEVFEFMMQMEEARTAQKKASDARTKGDPPPPPGVARVEFSRRAPDAADADEHAWYRWHVVDFEVDESVPSKEVVLRSEEGSGFELKGDRRKLKPPTASAATAAPPAMSERAKAAVAAAKAASSATPAPHDGKVTVTFGTARAEALLDLPAPGRVRADVSGGGVDRGTAAEEAEALAAMAALPNAMWVTVGLLARDGFAAQLKLKKTPGVHEAYRCAKTGVYWVYEPSGGFVTAARR